MTDTLASGIAGRWTISEVTIRVDDVASFAERTMSMARRLDAGELRREDAVLAFETMEQLLRVLTPGRWSLLRQLRGQGPSSIRGLAAALARDYRGVHADVATLIEAGLVVRGADGRVSVPWARISAEMALDTAA